MFYRCFESEGEVLVACWTNTVGAHRPQFESGVRLWPHVAQPLLSLPVFQRLCLDRSLKVKV